MYSKFIYLKGGETMEKKAYGVRIEPEVMEQLRIIAKKKDRTVSNLIRVVLKNYIDQQNI